MEIDKPKEMIVSQGKRTKASIQWRKVKPNRYDPGPRQWLGDDRFVIGVIRNNAGRAIRFKICDRCNLKLTRNTYRNRLMDAKQFCEDVLKNESKGVIHPRTDLVKAVRNDWDPSTQKVILKLIDYIDYKFGEVEKEIERVENHSEKDMDELKRDLRRAL